MSTIPYTLENIKLTSHLIWCVKLIWYSPRCMEMFTNKWLKVPWRKLDIWYSGPPSKFVNSSLHFEEYQINFTLVWKGWQNSHAEDTLVELRYRFRYPAWCTSTVNIIHKNIAVTAITEKMNRQWILKCIPKFNSRFCIKY